jgi:serine/threonine protein kinase
MAYNPSEEWEEEVDIYDEDYVESLVDRLPQPLTVDDFEWKLKLVAGAYGDIWLCTHHGIEGGEPLAVKKVDKKKVWEAKQVTQMLTERALCYKLQHPFIVRFGGCFQSPKHLYFITEYCAGGDLFFHLRRLTCLRQSPAMFYAACVVSVLEYLHNEHYIVYRDLKPENILLDRDGYIKLTDFGLAKVVPFKTYTFCGTPEYIPPEVLKMTGHGLGADWWQLGVLLYELLVGQPPFVGENPMDVYKLILRAKVRFPSMVTTEPKDFVRRCLRPNPARRIGCSSEGSEKVKAHEFFRGMKWDALLKKQLGKKEGAIVPKVRSPADASCFLDKAQRKAQEAEREEKMRKDKATQGREEEPDENATEEELKKAAARYVLGEAEWEGGEPPWGEEQDPFAGF